jgi:type VI secretion system secreted protein Hcp
MFLSVNGAKHGQITGESQDDKHKNEIEVLGWSWGMRGKAMLGGGTGTATGQTTIRELQIVKRVDRATTALMSALRYNEPIKEAVLTVRKVGKKPLEYLKIKLEDARVFSIDISVGEDPSNPTLIEKLTFTFNKINIDYTPQGPDGNALGSTNFSDEWKPGGGA